MDSRAFRAGDGVTSRALTTCRHQQRHRHNAGFSVSPDGRRLLYAQVDEDTSHIMLVENFRW
jgi:tRNA pseudouridine-54 N-methylase